MWYLLSGLGTLITASKCEIESLLPDTPQALSRKADQRLSVLAVILLCPPGRKFLRWLGWLRESPGQLRRRAAGLVGYALAASQREPPPAESHGPPEERLSHRLWGEAAELFALAERREREGWGEYLGACWGEFWGGLKRGGGVLWRWVGVGWEWARDGGEICLGLCWCSGVAAVKGVGGWVRGVWRRGGEQ